MSIKEKKPTQQTMTVERFNIGDRVVFKNFSNLNNKLFINNDYTMVVDEIRIMFARNANIGKWLKAYTVVFPNGDRGEYDETQLAIVGGCVNCDDTVLYPDERCPDCGRQE